MRRVYAKCFRYLRQRWIWVMLAVLVFVELLVFHCLHAEPGLGTYREYVAQTLPQYPNEFLFLAVGNSKSALWTVLMGAIPFGAGVFFDVFLQIKSLTAIGKYLLGDLGTAAFLAGVLPHGVVEILAMIMSVVCGVLISRAVTKTLLSLVKGQGRSALAEGAEEVRCIVGTVLLVVLPLVLIGAVIEVTVTPVIYAMFR